MTTLEGRSAVITGAGRGIGRAIAIELAHHGVHVALVARSQGELVETAAQVRELGASAAVVPADLGDTTAIGDVVRRVRGELGTIDIVVNNAAVVWPLGPSIEVEPDQWAASIAINVSAVASMTFAFLPAMLDQSWGRVVNVSSGVVGRPASMIGGNAYVTGKAAVEAHTLNLAAETASSGVTVNVFRPGAVDTAMQTWIREQDPVRIGAELHERFERMHSDGALLTPQQSAASLVARLATDATGQIWDVSDPL